MFVIFDCGCIGIKLEDMIILLDPCDANDFHQQNLEFKLLKKDDTRYGDLIQKNFRKLSPVIQEEYVEKIQDLINKGYRLELIRQLFKE